MNLYLNPTFYFSGEAIFAFARPNSFPIQKIILNKNIVKLKRILVSEQDLTIYGDIEIEDNAFKSISKKFPVTPAAIASNEEENCEIITPDDDHMAEIGYDTCYEDEEQSDEEVDQSRGSITQVFSYSPPSPQIQEDSESLEYEQVQSAKTIGRNPFQKKDTQIESQGPMTQVFAYPHKQGEYSESQGNTTQLGRNSFHHSSHSEPVIKEEPLEEENLLHNPFSKQEKTTRRHQMFADGSENIALKHEPLDLIDDDGEGDLCQEDDNVGEEVAIYIKSENALNEDGFFDEGNDYDLEDEEVDSKDNIFDPLVVKDHQDFQQTTSIYIDEDDPGQRSDFSYQPSDEEASLVDEEIDKRKSVKSTPKKRKFNVHVCPICGKRSKLNFSHINHMRESHPDHPYVKTS